MTRLLLRFTVALFCVGVAFAEDTLRFDQFIEAVRRAHPQMKSIEFERDAAEADMLQANAPFDFLFKAKADWKRFGDKDKIQFLDAGVEAPLATALAPRLSASLRQSDGSGLNPESSTGGEPELNLGITLPLLQGLRTDSRRTAREKAMLRPELASTIIDQERNSFLRSAALRYWDWVENTENLNIMRELITLAEERARQIIQRARVGEVSGADTLEAMQELERRRGDYLRIERSAEQSSIAARSLLWRDADLSLRKGISPMRIPEAESLTDTQRAQDRQEALGKRPEARRVQLQITQNNLDLRLSREQQLPLVEAQGQFLYRSESNSGNGFKLGLSLSHPLLTRAASAQEQLAEINLQRASFQQQMMQRQIHADIDDALSAMQRADQRVETAQREVYYSDLLHKAERQKWQSGESTLMLVNLRERALGESRMRLCTARADQLRARALYRWATAQW